MLEEGVVPCKAQLIMPWPCWVTGQVSLCSRGMLCPRLSATWVCGCNLELLYFWCFQATAESEGEKCDGSG